MASREVVHGQATDTKTKRVPRSGKSFPTNTTPTQHAQTMANPGFQLDCKNAYFKEDNRERYVQRTVLLDLEPGSLDSVRICSKELLCRLNNPIFDQAGAGNNWTKGHCTEGAELLDSTLFNSLKEAEGFDLVQGFQIILFMGDGKGPGSGTCLFPKIVEEFQDISSKSILVFLSPKVSNTVVEPCNVTLSFQMLVDLTDKVKDITNEAHYSTYFRTLKSTTQIYDDQNHLVFVVMPSATCSLRYQGQLKSDLWKRTLHLSN